MLRDAPIARELSGRLRLASQIGLEARVGDRDQRRGNFRVALSAQVSNPVFGDHDVAQVARDRDVPVVEDDVRFGRAARFTGRAQEQHRPCALELVRHRDEVVLSAHAAQHSPVL